MVEGKGHGWTPRVQAQTDVVQQHVTYATCLLGCTTDLQVCKWKNVNLVDKIPCACPPDVCRDRTSPSEACKVAIIGKRNTDLLQTRGIIQQLLSSLLLSDAAPTTFPNIISIIPHATNTCAPLQPLNTAASVTF